MRIKLNECRIDLLPQLISLPYDGLCVRMSWIESNQSNLRQFDLISSIRYHSYFIDFSLNSFQSILFQSINELNKLKTFSLINELNCWNWRLDWLNSEGWNGVKLRMNSNAAQAIWMNELARLARKEWLNEDKLNSVWILMKETN